MKNENLTMNCFVLAVALHLFFGWNPYCITRLFLDNVFDLLMQFFRGVPGHHGSEVFTELLLQLHRSLEQLPGLLLRHPLVHLQQGLDRSWLEEDS